MSSIPDSSSRVLRVCRRHLIRECIALLLFASLLLQNATAVAPEWWTVQGVLAPGATADDYAVANIGQLKTIGKKAAQAMETTLNGGAGTAITGMISTWAAEPASGVTRDDYTALNLGQLKTVAKLFYDRLAGGATPAYPWTGTNADDYALVNLGQLKTVFAFDVVNSTDTNHNGIPDSLEMQLFGNLNHDFTDDTDGDGINDGQEISAGTDPTNASSNSTLLLGLRVFTQLDDAT